MIKKFTIIILLFFVVLSCGKKGDPKYVNPDKKVEIKEVLINLV
jgi:predicted small lipoprotein YifL